MSVYSEHSNTKNKFAQLLAAEGLSVRHDGSADTAYFDLNKREVVLPMWKEMTDDFYRMLLCHEVGHALFTPKEGWHSSTKEYGHNFAGFLNITEDARIEKKMKRKFPGLRKDFFSSYKSMWFDRDMFGVKDRDPNSMNLIDRLNMFAKVGESTGLVFEGEDKVWLDRLMNTESFEDAKKLALELFEKAKDEMSETAEDGLRSGSQSGSDKSEESSDGDVLIERDNSASESKDSSDSSYSSYSSDSSDSSDSDSGASTGDNRGKDPFSETDNNFRANEKDLADVSNNSPSVQIVGQPENFNVNDLIHDYKKVLNDFDHHVTDLTFSNDFNNHKETVDKFLANNKKVVAYLAKEFEMKKAATEHARTVTNKTGVVDPLKIHTYKYNEDIFLSTSTVMSGKSHGLVMMVDWSGSMGHNILGTVEQMLNLVMFCRKVAIPFEVFAFSDCFPRENNIYSNHNEVKFNGLTMINLFSSRMKKAEFNKMTYYIHTTASAMDQNGMVNRRSVAPGYGLGGTPLNDAIIAMRNIVEDFRTRTGADIINTVILSDGASGHLAFNNKNNTRRDNILIYKDKLTGYEYPLSDVEISKDRHGRKTWDRSYSVRRPETYALLQMLKECANVNVVGFFLTEAGQHALGRSAAARGRQKNKEIKEILSWQMNINQYSSDMEELCEKFRADRYVISTTSGYDALFILAGGKELMVEETKPEFESDMTTRKLASTFIAAHKTKLLNRVVLNKFIELIA
tara:strand:- start:3290 stop:5512 length:2223 start_codon:yes stop_codon:yes gene_type:complete